MQGDIRLYHVDHLGSTSLVTDIDGEITQHVAYIPYGEVFVEQRNGSWNTPYLFNAKELDEETGLYYYGARYLDPTHAAWLSVDPLFEKYVGMTPYNYCAGNPIMSLDPNGEAIFQLEDGSESYIIPKEDEEKIYRKGDLFIKDGKRYVKVSDTNDMNDVKKLEKKDRAENQNKQKFGMQIYGIDDKEKGDKAKKILDSADPSDSNFGWNSISADLRKWFGRKEKPTPKSEPEPQQQNELRTVVEKRDVISNTKGVPTPQGEFWKRSINDTIIITKQVDKDGKVIKRDTFKTTHYIDFCKAKGIKP